MTEKLNDCQFLDYLEDKTVALVGPAASTKGSGNGAEIDTYDIVCRLNKHSATQQKYAADIGTRSNVLFTTPNTFKYNKKAGYRVFDMETIKNLNIDWCVSTLPIEHTSRKHYEKGAYITKNLQMQIEGAGIKFQAVPLEFRKNLHAKVRVPSTGLSAIVYLLTAKIKKLKVFGMDFYATKMPYMEDYKPAIGNISRKEIMEKLRKNNTHNPCAEFLYFAGITDERLERDAILERIISGISPNG